MNSRLGALLAIGVSVMLWPARMLAQAFTPPGGVGSITLAWQLIDNTGHRFSDGLLLSRGDSVTKSVLLEVDYGITDRLSATAGVPYVFAKYTGAMPPASNLPVDACGCWHSSIQDLSFGARYRFGGATRALTPSIRFVIPTHDYRYEGEAVVGRRLRETQIGVDAGVRLQGVLHRATIQASYSYSFVERPLPDVSINRSNGALSVGYAVTDRFFMYAVGAGQHTHGGLRIGSPSGEPFFPPGELNTRERYAQRDRLLSVHYLQAGGGAAYSLGAVDLFASYTRYVWGRNAHNGHTYTIGTTWHFDRSGLD